MNNRHRTRSKYWKRVTKRLFKAGKRMIYIHNEDGTQSMMIAQYTLTDQLVNRNSRVYSIDTLMKAVENFKMTRYYGESKHEKEN